MAHLQTERNPVERVPPGVMTTGLVSLVLASLPALLFWWDFGWTPLHRDPTLGVALRGGSGVSQLMIAGLLASRLGYVALLLGLRHGRGKWLGEGDRPLKAVAVALVPYLIAAALIATGSWRSRPSWFGGPLGMTDLLVVIAVMDLFRRDEASPRLTVALVLAGLTAPVSWWVLNWNTMGQRFASGRIEQFIPYRTPSLTPLAWAFLLAIVAAWLAVGHHRWRRRAGADQAPARVRKKQERESSR